MAARIRALRHKRGFTLEDVARDVGVTRSCICQWEAGRSQPRHIYLLPLAECLRTTVAYLIAGDERQPSDAQKREDPSVADVLRRAREGVAAELGLDPHSVRVEIDCDISPGAGE